jgi:serine/threonine-protein kinase
VGDTFNNKIRKIAPGGIVTTFAGSGAPGSADGAGTAAAFFGPIGVAFDGAGNIYVADVSNNKIRKIAPGGIVTTFAGSGARGSADGTGTAASFAGPYGVSVDADGNVYVADFCNNRIRRITPGGVVTTLAGSGSAGSADGPGAAASFAHPSGVAVDGSGNVYVADLLSNKIRKITPGGVVTTFAGSGAEGSADGVGTAASFNLPAGVAVDGSGNVYVAEISGNKIRKITPGGIVTTFAGSGVQGSADGAGPAAEFFEPMGVAVDGAGNVYVADRLNNKIRKVAPSSEVCRQDASTACLIGGRYKVTSHWQNQYAGGQVSDLSATRLTDGTAGFWLSDASMFEYLIRIDTATNNGRAWISIPTFTDVEFWVDVTDMMSGQYFEYHSPAGNRTMLYDPYTFVYP